MDVTKKIMDVTKKISCDIDGILTSYPKCWLEYLELQSGIKYPTIEEAKRKEPKYKAIKAAYRRSSFKADLSANPQGVELLIKIRELGYMILMATSRPLHDPDYPELKQLTERWLTKNDIPFNDLVYKNETVDFVDVCGPINYHIEDELKYAEVMRKKNITTFVYNPYLDHEIVTTEHKIIIVPSLLLILNYIK